MTITTIAGVSSAYLSRRTDPIEVLEACIHRIQEESAGAVGVIASLTFERARESARASAQRWRKGQPLSAMDGIPMVWKDVFDMSGQVTKCGSAVRKNASTSTEDAALVRQLEASGVLSVAKTGLSEFAYSGLGINPFAGTPVNPWDPKTPRIVGGSSSGSAAAVIRGWVPCAMGSDTSGSLRVPAAFTGLVGFKPSHARYATGGMFPLAPSLDTAGPLVRDVRDASLLDAVLTGASAPTIELSDWTFVVPKGRALAVNTQEVQTVFEGVLELLCRQGVKVVERVFDVFEKTRDLFDQHGTLVAVEATQVHRELLQSEALNLVDPRVAARMKLGAQLSESASAQVKGQRVSLLARSQADLPAGEVLLYPTVCMTAPEIAPLDEDAAWFAACNARVLQNTMLGSYLNMPTLSLPAGQATNGLPVGISLSMNAGSDSLLLGLAQQLQDKLRSG
ncbi:amidase family protein [Ottowia thiooxydans]|uniref:amidase family protein n=1 Tax=Ottowia thiooxydans TaxID=219182 RepID=UPI0004106717|nr:amidase family protein [Ottowia thiooxydans]